MSGRPSHEVAEIFRRMQDSGVPVPAPRPEQRRVFHRILRCPTAAIGGHVDACSDCGHREISYNSCRDRHCPKCQGSAQADWLEARQTDVLPVPYAHVVFAKPPFDGPDAVLTYLARYTHRVAISNHRLVSLDDQRVRFRFKDYRGRRVRHQELPLAEFARRFLLHVLPRRFVRIRYYGILANGCRRRLLTQCRQALEADVEPSGPVGDPSADALPDGEGLNGLLPVPPRLCLACKKAMLACVEAPQRPPPFLRSFRVRA